MFDIPCMFYKCLAGDQEEGDGRRCHLLSLESSFTLEENQARIALSGEMQIPGK